MNNTRNTWCLIFSFAWVLCMRIYTFGALEETIDFSGITDLDVGDTRAAMRHYACASGFFITRNGYLVTDKYLIAEAKNIIVVYKNRAYEAHPVKVAPVARFSLLKVDGGIFPQATIAQGDARKTGERLLVGGFAVSDEHGTIAQYIQGVISGVTKSEYELYVQTVPEQGGAVVVNRHGFCEGMLLGTAGRKRQTVNRVLQWRKIYESIPATVRTYLRYDGNGYGGVNALEFVEQCSALVLAYNDEIREKNIRALGKNGQPIDKEDGKKITIKDLRTLTLKSSQGKTHYAGNGSGFFITPDGYFITNNHVIDGAEEIVVIYADKAYKADVIAKSKDKDLALLKTEGRFKVVQTSAGNPCAIGQTIFVVGYPNIDIQGLDAKVTKGIISSNTGLGGNNDLCQMDAAIQPGNSGGPVADENGRVVGVTVSQVNKRFANAELANYMIKWQIVSDFLPQGVVNSVERNRKEFSDMRFTDAVCTVVSATGLVVTYEKGHSVIAATEVKTDEQGKMRRYVQRQLLAVRAAKLHGEWKEVEEHAKEILRFIPNDSDAQEFLALAQMNLGKHLIIRATVGVRDVKAKITPVCGFKNPFVHCEEPLELFDKEKKVGFPVIARLTYEEKGNRYEGQLECIYNWKGTKEIHIELLSTSSSR